MNLLATARNLGRLSVGIREAAEEVVFPHACLVCGGDGEAGPFCISCRDELCQANGLCCPRCAEPVGPFAKLDGGCARCRTQALGYDRALTLGPYEGPIRELCLSMKELRHAWLARWMADLILDVQAEAIRESGVNAVVAVPLHWRRRWKRGYNQADALASRMAARLEYPLIGGLRRVLHTPKLADLSRAERAKILGRSFHARLNPRWKGRTILLVDDILTTGATCGAAARALKRAGASRVVVAVVARA